MFKTKFFTYINSDDGNVVIDSHGVVLRVVDVLRNEENNSASESAGRASPKVNELRWSGSGKTVGSR